MEDGYGYPFYLERKEIELTVHNPQEGYCITIDQNYIPQNDVHTFRRIDIHNNGQSKYKVDADIFFEMLLGQATGTGLKVDFELRDTDYKVVDSYTFSFFKPVGQNLHAKKYINQSYVSHGNAWSIKGYKLDDEEIINFAESDFTYTLTRDRRLDLSMMYLNYEKGYTLYHNDYSNFMYIYDPENYYQYFDHDDEGFIIPIEWEQENNKILMYTKNLYVNPNTLEMSPEPRYGFEPTSEFYVPVGREMCLDNEFNYIRLNQITLGRDMIYLDTLEYIDLEESFIGLCGSSTYCVSGGIKE